VSARKARRRPKKTTAPAAPPFAERLQSERKRLFRAMGVIECCRFACNDDIDPEDVVNALEAAYDIVDEVASHLGVMGDEAERDALERGEAPS
jgi:hypothetical protein